ncbi:MAG: purine nucleoside permease [Opitutaceae bacterium]
MKIFCLQLALILALTSNVKALGKPMVIKVVVVTTFESGADTGDKPGEFQHWAERERWTERIAVPGVKHPVLSNGEGVLGVVCGTTVRAANQIMALVLDPRFDFSHAYWLVSGIAGVDPADASLGSAAWARFVVDGDIAYEIDSREADKTWPYAIIPIGAKKPNEIPKNEGWEPDVMSYALNQALVERAFALTKNVTLVDTPEMQAYRATYVGFPNAQRPPFVLIGDSFGSCRYWHGTTLTQWANDWSKLWTKGEANFVMSNMEDHGIASAISQLSKMGKADFQRLLILRTGSNYCKPAPAQGVVQSLQAEYAGWLPSLESAYRVGSVMLHDIIKNWDAVYAGGLKTPQ